MSGSKKTNQGIGYGSRCDVEYMMVDFLTQMLRNRREMMELMTVITMLALLELVYFGAKVGAARGKYDIKAPATTGNEIFERHYRVHYNTIEQLMLFLPGLWAFGYYVGQYWAAGIGVVYLVGRLIYGAMYVKDPESRGIGTLFSVIPCWILILGGLIGAVVQFP
jgi:hypothetical protein